MNWRHTSSKSCSWLETVTCSYVDTWWYARGGGGGGILVGVGSCTIKERVLGTEVAQNAVLRSLFINYLYFYLSTWSTGGGVFWHCPKKRDLRYGWGKHGGGGLYRGTYLYWTYMWVSHHSGDMLISRKHMIGETSVHYLFVEGSIFVYGSFFV